MKSIDEILTALQQIELPGVFDPESPVTVREEPECGRFDASHSEVVQEHPLSAINRCRQKTYVGSHLAVLQNTKQGLSSGDDDTKTGTARWYPFSPGAFDMGSDLIDGDADKTEKYFVDDSAVSAGTFRINLEGSGTFGPPESTEVQGVNSIPRGTATPSAVLHSSVPGISESLKPVDTLLRTPPSLFDVPAEASTKDLFFDTPGTARTATSRRRPRSHPLAGRMTRSDSSPDPRVQDPLRGTAIPDVWNRPDILRTPIICPASRAPDPTPIRCSILYPHQFDEPYRIPWRLRVRLWIRSWWCFGDGWFVSWNDSDKNLSKYKTQ